MRDLQFNDFMETYMRKFGLLFEKLFKHDYIMLCLAILIGGICSILHGVDRSFDVRNYHIYNPYAFLNNRMTTDIMPADIQSYFNPLLDVPYYLMIKHLNNFPYLVAFIQGFSYALLIFITYKIAKFIFEGSNKNLYILLSVIIGSTGALTLYNIGTLTHDIFVGDIVLISIYLILKVIKKHSYINTLLSGILLGSICGLKLTAGIFGFAIICSLPFFYKEVNKPIKTICLFVTSVFIGFLITNGFWMWKLYSIFHNPFFPYFNSIFKSDFTNCADMLKTDFQGLYPENIWQYLFFPFYFYQHLPTKGFEINYQDFRFAAIYVCLIINIFIYIANKFSKFSFENTSINFKAINFMFLISIFTYLVWINTFATIRYLTPISAISGIVVIATLTKLLYFIKQYFSLNDIIKFNHKDYHLELNYKNFIIPSLIVCIAFYLVLKTIEPDMLKRVPIHDKVLEVQTMNIPDNAIVLVASGSGMIVPFQNPNAKYIYLNAPRFTEENIYILSDKNLTEIKNQIYKNKDKTYFIMDLAIYQKTFNLTQKTLNKYAELDIYKSNCKFIYTNIYNKKNRSFYILCKADIK